MQLEDYFEFAEPDIIRLKGHRIFLEHILERWLQGYSPEHIVQDLPTLTLEEVYAAITYDLHNQAAIDTYLERARQLGAEQMRQADA
jgi:uncharacterized protein (DUF433 family)